MTDIGGMRSFLPGSLAAGAFLIGGACIATDVWIALNLLGVADDGLDPHWPTVAVWNMIGLWFLALGAFAIKAIIGRARAAGPQPS
jgi:hypothetical protein